MPVASWKLLGFPNNNSLRTEITRLYERKLMNQREIGNHLGIHPETVSRLFIRYSIASRDHIDRLFVRSCNSQQGVRITHNEQEVLTGLLLGDGHIAYEGGLSSRYTHGSKHKATLQSIALSLPSLCFSKLYYYSRSNSWFIKTRSYMLLNSWRQQWYPHGKKLVPPTMRLSSISCYWWFIGDGSISKNRYDLKLSTDGFSDACRTHLANQLMGIGIHTSTTSSGSMLVASSDVPKFYRYIGPCRNPEYYYKWNYEHPRWTFRRIGMRGKKCAR